MIVKIENDEDEEILSNIHSAWRQGEITLEEMIHLRLLVIKRQWFVVEESWVQSPARIA